MMTGVFVFQLNSPLANYSGVLWQLTSTHANFM
jgi:hypothetical protein